MHSLAHRARRVAANLHAFAVVLLTLAAGLAVPAIAFGQDCTTAADLAGIVASEPPAVIEHELMGADAAAWVAQSPRMPPALRAADRIVVVGVPGAPVNLVYVLRDGCVIGTGTVPTGRTRVPFAAILGAGVET